jgi:hypothetical protein
MKYILVTGLILGALAGILCLTNPLLAKWLIGEAFYLGKPQKIQVKYNGNLSNKFEVYLKKYNVTNSKNDLSKTYFLIKRKDVESKKDDFRVIIIDTAQRTVFLTSDSNKDIVKWFGCLWQSETSHNSLVDVRNDIKGLNFDPDFRYLNQTYSFNLPQKSTIIILEVEKYEIIF